MLFYRESIRMQLHNPQNCFAKKTPSQPSILPFASSDLAVFNSISVISGQWESDYERICAKRRRLDLDNISPLAGTEITIQGPKSGPITTRPFQLKSKQEANMNGICYKVVDVYCKTEHRNLRW